jgi:hypothetical protein
MSVDMSSFVAKKLDIIGSALAELTHGSGHKSAGFAGGYGMDP